MRKKRNHKDNSNTIDDAFVPDVKGGKAAEEEHSSLHGVLAQVMLQRLKGGAATAADLSAIRQFLKDNNISCDGPRNRDLAAIVHRRAKMIHPGSDRR